MKTLRKTIRKIILESTSRAKTISDIPEGSKIELKDTNGGCCTIQWFLPGDDSFDPSASFTTATTDNSRVHELGAAYINNPALDGFGPMLADISMEWTTKVARKWLAMDRSSATEDAQKLWQYYKDHRLGVDVKGLQLDDRINTMTSKKSDNIDSRMADEVMMGFGSGYWSATDEKEYQRQFYKENALMWAFKKKSVLIPQLLGMPEVFTIDRW